MNLKMLKQPIKLAPGKGLKLKSPTLVAKEATKPDFGPEPLHNIDVQYGDISQPFDFKENNWLTVGDGCGSQKYFSRADKIKKAVKWGQLKLFTSELQFLNKYWDADAIPNPIIIYAGAAPGNHVHFLAKMIPQATFYLYDTQPFDTRLYELDNVKIGNRYFTMKDDVEYFKQFNDRIFFISDIRSLEYEKGFQGVEEYERKNEEMALADMNLQMEWVKELKPVKAHLKFRLPYEYKWTDKDYKYVRFLDGDLYKQPWSAPTSTETRLVPDMSLPERNWDFRVYESMMFYHNNIVREHIHFVNPLTNINEPICQELGLTQDYDSTVFVMTIKEYIQKFNGNTDPESVLKLCKAIIEDVGKNIVSIAGLRSGANNETKLYAIQKAMKEARITDEDDE